MAKNRLVELLYAPNEAIGHLTRVEATAVLVLIDTHQPWSNPGFAQWLQLVFIDMPCNGLERMLCRIGALFGRNAKELETCAVHRFSQVWRGHVSFSAFLKRAYLCN